MLELYLWLTEERSPINNYGSLCTVNGAVNSAMIKEALECLRQEQTAFTREARLKHFNPIEARAEKNQSNRSITYRFSSETDIENAKIFLSFCQEWLEKQNNEEISFSFLALLFLIDPRSPIIPQLPEKTGVLFSHLMGTNKILANQFYQEHFQSIFVFNPQTITDKCLVIIELSRLKFMLAREKNLMGILLLSREFFMEPIKLAALILYLLEQNLSTTTLIKSGILHDFIAYNLFNIDGEDSVIRKFYALLGQFDIASQTIQQASQCVIQISNYQVLYSLDGFVTQNELSPIEIEETLFEFTISNDNFTNLYNLFGNQFLIAAFNWLARDNQNSLLKSLLIQVINNKSEIGLTLNELTGIINTVAKNTPDFLEILAEIIEDETIQTLIRAHVGAVFYLAPFKPLITRTIKEMSCLQAYVSDLLKSNTNVYDSIGQLISLLRQFNDQNDILYSTILKLVIEKSSLQETEVLDYLKFHASKYESQLKQRMHELCNVLKQSIEAMNEFSIEGCKAVEDCWYSAVREYEILSKLITTDSYYPENKYAFFACLIKNLVNNLQFNVHLKEFLKNMLEFPTQADELCVTEFERTLIEILAVVDNPTIRDQAIELLETTPRKEGKWLHHIYGKESIFARIGKFGNTGLLIYLAERNKIGGWRSIPDLMNEAAAAGHLDIIQYLCELTTNPRPDKFDILNALEHAVINDKPLIVNALCSLNTIDRPDAEKVAAMLRLAATHQKADIVRCICSLTTNNKPGIPVISGLVEELARSQQWEMLKCVLTSESKPDSNAIKAASKWASLNQKWDILSTLQAQQVPSIEAEPEIKSEASGSAIKNSGSTFFSNRSNHEDPPPNPPVLGFTLDQLANINKLICKLEHEINSYWPYPDKDRKRHKVAGLNKMLGLALNFGAYQAVQTIETEFTEIRKGVMSTRTADLLDTLRAESSLGINPANNRQ